MKPPKGKVVDHISGNKLDNTRANLRNITQGQNIRNKAKCFGSTSIYKGVYYDEKRHRWEAHICFNNRNLFLGRFDSEVEAACAYDRAAVGAFGEFARLNFPEEWPAKRIREVHAQWLRQQARQKRKARAATAKARTRTKAPARKAPKKAAARAKRVTKRASRRGRASLPRK
ncbi:MAG: hypothetical protein EHM35_13565, partial [Planctomycetaceae bacterium]